MIFRKVLCGGFGILMSQNDQVEKNLAFQCGGKMVPSFSSSYMDAPDNHLEYLKIYTVVSIVSAAVWGCLGVSEGEPWFLWVVFWDFWSL